jgi:hypothetical protein
MISNEDDIAFALHLFPASEDFQCQNVCSNFPPMSIFAKHVIRALLRHVNYYKDSFPDVPFSAASLQLWRHYRYLLSYLQTTRLSDFHFISYDY